MPPSLNIPLIYFMYAAFAAFNLSRLFFADAIIIDKVFTYNTLFVGIAFFITNYFCGNKSVFAMLNSHQCTLSTISVVCLAKTEP